MQLIVRKEYLNELIELYGTPDIKSNYRHQTKR